MFIHFYVQHIPMPVSHILPYCNTIDSHVYVPHIIMFYYHMFPCLFVHDLHCNQVPQEVTEEHSRAIPELTSKLGGAANVKWTFDTTRDNYRFIHTAYLTVSGQEFIAQGMSTT